MLWFDDVSYFHDQDKHVCSLEKLLVDWPMNIGMRASKHAIRNCSVGDHKCVVNHGLQPIHDN